MDSNTIKEAIINRYGKLAQTRKNGLFTQLFPCCDTKRNAKMVGRAIGYSEEEINAVPEQANLGVGCGNPTALATMTRGEVVVDLGSGAGFDAFIVAPLLGESGKVIGIDLSDEMLELARKNAKQGAYKNVQFVKGDIEQIPLESAFADHVISNCVINLSQNKTKVFQEAYRILKKTGQLSISDIVLEKELPAFVKHSLGGHIACVSGAEKLDHYLAILKAVGFRDIKVTSKNKFPLELILNDPQVRMLAKKMNFDLNSEQAKDIASRVASISLTAKK